MWRIIYSKKARIRQLLAQDRDDRISTLYNNLINLSQPSSFMRMMVTFSVMASVRSMSLMVQRPFGTVFKDGFSSLGTEVCGGVYMHMKRYLTA
jgi:hypothetical protein